MQFIFIKDDIKYLQKLSSDHTTKIADSFMATVFSFLQIIHIAYLLTYVGRIKKYLKMEFLRLHSPYLGQVDAVYH